ncbi:MAG: dolichyl-phosphate beta-D-mannosyltransferase [Spirochaetes bacterium GWF1_41_5]|nr:MAG: dolichyl-phosphate beta-D-mannosyltransferase [Spirochaetes bacterium GWF1_41_5]HBE03159.1 dolichyl-phosphate beta-D-mannosyltransferase [Spirochaetia bacterium]
MKIAIVIPTYNEKKNIRELVKALFKINNKFHIFIVDDNSPDGTGKLIDQLKKKYPNLHALHRPVKQGIGPAYIFGFSRALEIKPDYIIQMDADFSHPPEVIPEMLQKIRKADLVIGSRYCRGISVLNWPLRRLLLSYFANLLARFLTGIPVTDATGGFKCFRARVLSSIDLSRIKSNGYFFQIEMNYAVFKNNFRIIETGIVFTDRHAGTSKMTRSIIFEALIRLFFLRFKKYQHSR